MSFFTKSGKKRENMVQKRKCTLQGQIDFFLSAKNRQDYVQKQPEKRFYLHTF